MRFLRISRGAALNLERRQNEGDAKLNLPAIKNMATLEQIIDEVRALSPAEKLKLRQTLDRELEQAALAQSRATESNWVERHRDKYLGQWVALEGDRLIAHGTNAREVHLAARQAGIAGPYIVHVTPKVEAYVGGW